MSNKSGDEVAFQQRYLPGTGVKIAETSLLGSAEACQLVAWRGRARGAT